MREAPGDARPQVAGARWNCTACHVPQTNAPLVTPAGSPRRTRIGELPRSSARACASGNQPERVTATAERRRHELGPPACGRMTVVIVAAVLGARSADSAARGEGGTLDDRDTRFVVLIALWAFRQRQPTRNRKSTSLPIKQTLGHERRSGCSTATARPATARPESATARRRRRSTKAPADLTKISARNGGAVPRGQGQALHRRASTKWRRTAPATCRCGATCSDRSIATPRSCASRPLPTT